MSKIQEEAIDDVKETIIENQLLDTVTISIVVNCLLLVSTIIASEFFGIPEFIQLRMKCNGNHFSNPIGMRFENLFYIIVYTLGFFAIQLWYAGVYLFKSVTNSLYALKDVDIKSLKTNLFGQELLKERNAMKSVISLAIAACWCLGIYNSVKSRNVAKQVFNTNPTIPEKIKSKVDKMLVMQNTNIN